MVKLKQGDLWLVGSPDFLTLTSTVLQLSQHRGKPVKLDFVDAQYTYVMQILAQELGVKLVMEKELSSGVTVFCQNSGLPAEDLVTLVAANEGFTYRLEPSTLYVGTPTWLKTAGHGN